MRKRLFSELIKILVIVLVGIAYYLINTFTGFSIPCVFYEITGYKCPGCGITRMIKALLVFDFKAAYTYNECLFITWPLIAIPLIYSEVKYIKTGCRTLGKMNILLYAEVAILLIYGVLRNIM